MEGTEGVREGAAGAAEAGGAGGSAGAGGGEQVFVHDAHRRYLQQLDEKKDTVEFAMIEHLRVSGIYWALCAMDLLGARGEMPEASIVDFVVRCWDERAGAFGGTVGHDAHLLHTLSALQVLALCRALERVPSKERVVAWVASLQQADGSFSGDAWGEVDTRFTYCALASLAILGRLDAVDVARAAAFVESCRSFDRSFGAVAGAESHAGQVFCCLGALSIAGRLGSEADADALGWWLAERQCDGGGLNGRPEKQPDVCYSWWVLSSLLILGRDHWIDRKALLHFILRCQDEGHGGIADRPGDMADVYHTFFGICGLSMLGYFRATGVEDGAAAPATGFCTKAVDPTFALPVDLCRELGLVGHRVPPAPALGGPCAVSDGWSPSAADLGISHEHARLVLLHARRPDP
jgi:geranylgeranyl transferase type-2 subunit beta